MASKKSPFLNASEEQIARVEKDSHIIQVGSEIYYEGNYCAFSKEKADHYLEVIKAGLKETVQHGNDIERDEALLSCYNLRVIPLRIQ